MNCFYSILVNNFPPKKSALVDKTPHFCSINLQWHGTNDFYAKKMLAMTYWFLKVSVFLLLLLLLLLSTWSSTTVPGGP